jgi:hypothetical protein
MMESNDVFLDSFGIPVSRMLQEMKPDS